MRSYDKIVFKKNVVFVVKLEFSYNSLSHKVLLTFGRMACVCVCVSVYIKTHTHTCVGKKSVLNKMNKKKDHL